MSLYLMIFLLWLGAGSFLTCLVLTPVISRLAKKAGLVDRPDGRRKMHVQPIPVCGGIAVFVSMAVVLAAAYFLSSSSADLLREKESSLGWILLASSLLCLLGLADDVGWIRGRHKLVGQILAVSLVMASGLVFRRVTLSQEPLELGLLAMPLTGLFLVVAINGFNLIDGMDGLLGCVGAVTALALSVLALLQDLWLTAGMGLVLTGSLLGFLPYNYPPARLFLGDAGSMVIGLLLGVLTLENACHLPGSLALTAPLALLTLPFLDTAAAVIRRKLTGRSIYNTDRSHLHHCLLRRGLTPKQVLLLVTSLCLLTSLGAVAGLVYRHSGLSLMPVFLVMAGLIISRSFGHAELFLCRERLKTMVFSFLHWENRGQSHRSEVQLQGSGRWQLLMDCLTRAASDFNLKSVLLDINAPALHEGYHAHWNRNRFEDNHEGPTLWHASLPVEIGDQIVGNLELAGYLDKEAIWFKIAAISRLLEDFALVQEIPEGDRQKAILLLSPSPSSDPAQLKGKARAG